MKSGWPKPNRATTSFQTWIGIIGSEWKRVCCLPVARREIGEQFRQCGPGVGQGALADDLAGGIENADVMRPVSEIKAEGEPAGNNHGGRGEMGRAPV